MNGPKDFASCRPSVSVRYQPTLLCLDTTAPAHDGRYWVASVAGVVHTGRMGRTVSAVVTWGDAYLGVIGPFPVSIPWWSEVEPVVARLHQVLDVPVLVLRLLLVEGGEGGRDGHVTYHVAALNRPAPGLLAERPVDQVALTRPEDLRSPWARVEGIREVLSWASDMLRAAGRRVTGPAVQRKTWNLDFADAQLGNPVLDGLRACDFLPEGKRPTAARAWIDAWATCIPGCDPARALSVAEPLAHLTYAVRYQEFLDGIEPTERIYHLGDPAAAIRAALRSARDLR